MLNVLSKVIKYKMKTHFKGNFAFNNSFMMNKDLNIYTVGLFQNDFEHDYISTIKLINSWFLVKLFSIVPEKYFLKRPSRISMNQWFYLASFFPTELFLRKDSFYKWSDVLHTINTIFWAIHRNSLVEILTEPLNSNWRFSVEFILAMRIYFISICTHATLAFCLTVGYLYLH